MNADLIAERAIDSLIHDFPTIDAVTIRRLYEDSVRTMSTARVAQFTPALAERLARERLRAVASGGATGDRSIPGVLFLCVHNAGRSQMAAGWFRALAAGRAAVYSGGSEPAADLNPAVVAAMHEVGISIEDEFPKPWTDEVARAVDVIVTMGCGDECPVYPGVRVEDWELEDPAGHGIEAVRPIRDDIEQRVRALLTTLGVNVNQQVQSGSERA
ncbi:MAG: arsenate reductase ArsC [Chloroflexota bacterium]